MIGLAPMCERCVRLDRKGTGYSCQAFPEGIPEAIAVGGYDHTEEYPGDHGLRFLPMHRGRELWGNVAGAASLANKAAEMPPGTVSTHVDGSRWIKKPGGEWERLPPIASGPAPAPTAQAKRWPGSGRARSFRPGVKLRGTLNGVEVSSWDAPKTLEEWKHVSGQRDVGAPPFRPKKGTRVGPKGEALGFHSAAGAIVEEPDGRVWIVSPKGAFGGYKNTFPKGTIEQGMSVQATTIKEVYEESGLQVEITGFLGDFERSTSKTRYYLARRVGGTPADAGEETEAVHLVPREELIDHLDSVYDWEILQALAEARPRREKRGQEGARP